MKLIEEAVNGMLEHLREPQYIKAPTQFILGFTQALEAVLVVVEMAKLIENDQKSVKGERRYGGI